MKQSFTNAVEFGKRHTKKAFAAAGAAGLAMSQSVYAAIDVTGVNTAIGNAETSAHSVGTTVIGVIAGLAVIGIVVGLVRKL